MSKAPRATPEGSGGNASASRAREERIGKETSLPEFSRLLVLS